MAPTKTAVRPASDRLAAMRLDEDTARRHYTDLLGKAATDTSVEPLHVAEAEHAIRLAVLRREAAEQGAVEEQEAERQAILQAAVDELQAGDAGDDAEFAEWVDELRATYRKGLGIKRRQAARLAQFRIVADHYVVLDAPGPVTLASGFSQRLKIAGRDVPREITFEAWAHRALAEILAEAFGRRPPNPDPARDKELWPAPRQA